MPKAAKTLTSREVNAITKVGLTALGGADGLYLSVKDSGTRSYVDRYRVRNTGRRTMIGLGSVADISLKDARAKAMELRKIVDHSICLSNSDFVSRLSKRIVKRSCQLARYGEGNRVVLKSHIFSGQNKGPQMRARKLA